MKAIPPEASPVLIELGRALLVVQYFERYLAKCLKIVGFADGSKTSTSALFALDRATLGRLMAEFRKKLDLPEDFASSFSELLAARNTLIHTLQSEPWFDLSTQQGCVSTLLFIERIYALCQKCNSVLVAFLIAESERYGVSRPVPSSNTDARFLKTIDEDVLPKITRKA